MSSQVAQKLLHVDEVYLYRIPKLSSSGGYRAEEWNLADPLETCSLDMERRANQLFLLFVKDKALFAMSKIDVEESKMARFVEPVVDSSRYFVVRLWDETTKRDALIGFGFRERDEATDFLQVLQHYEKSIQREHKELDTPALHTLQQGETIHFEKGGHSVITSPTKFKKAPTAAPTASIPLLKKPPPPASPEAGKPIAAAPSGEVDISFDIQLNERSGVPDGSTGADSAVAVADESESDSGIGGSTDNDLDDEDWNDFESSTPTTEQTQT